MAGAWRAAGGSCAANHRTKGRGESTILTPWIGGRAHCQGRTCGGHRVMVRPNCLLLVPLGVFLSAAVVQSHRALGPGKRWGPASQSSSQSTTLPLGEDRQQHDEGGSAYLEPMSRSASDALSAVVDGAQSQVETSAWRLARCQDELQAQMTMQMTNITEAEDRRAQLIASLVLPDSGHSAFT